MTADEVRDKINNRPAGVEWQSVMFVDSVTYASCCQYIFNKIGNTQFPLIGTLVSLGVNHGLLFKGVELILDPTLDKN